MEWYKLFWTNYFNIDGRARRTAYWVPTIINVIIGMVLPALEAAIYGIPSLSLLYWLAAIIPSFTNSVRRLHDIGKSGWWLLIVFVPLIGVIVLLIFYLLDSQPGPNRYGPNPKENGVNQGYQGYQSY